MGLRPWKSGSNFVFCSPFFTSSPPVDRSTSAISVNIQRNLIIPRAGTKHCDKLKNIQGCLDTWFSRTIVCIKRSPEYTQFRITQYIIFTPIFNQYNPRPGRAYYGIHPTYDHCEKCTETWPYLLIWQYSTLIYKTGVTYRLDTCPAHLVSSSDLAAMPR